MQFSRIASIGFITFVSLAAASFPLTPRIYTPLTIVAVLFWVIQFRRNKTAFSRVTLVKAFISILVLHTILLFGLLYTDDMSQGFKVLETKSSLMVIPIIILFSRITQHQIHIIIIAFIFSILLISGFCLFSVVLNAYDAGDGLYQFITGYQYQTTYFTEPVDIHPTYLSLFVSLCVFYILGNSARLHYVPRIILIMTVLFFVSVNMILLSRGGLLAFFIAGIFFLIHTYLVKIWKPGVVIAVASVSLIIGVILFKTIPNFKYRFSVQIENINALWNNYDSENSASLHFMSWKCALNNILTQKIFFGHGTGDEIVLLVACYKTNGWHEMADLRFNAHSEYLSVLIRHGLVGLLSFLTIFFLAFKQSIKHRDTVFTSFLILFLIVSAFESTLNVYKGVVFFALFYSLFLKDLDSREFEFNNQNSVVPTKGESP